MPEQISGAELARQLRCCAIDRGVSMTTLLEPVTAHPATWLGQLQRAQTPKPHTIARVQALIAGGPVPPAPPNNFQKPTLRRASVLPREGKIDGADNLPRVDRDPCPRCGVRRDIGCHHTARAVSSRIPL